MQSMQDVSYLLKQTVENQNSYLKTIGDWEKDMKKKEKDFLSNDRQLVEAEKEKERGNKYVKSKDWGSAIKAYTKAIEINPSEPIFFANRALCYLKIGKPREAEADCTEALSFDPKYIKALQRRGAAREYLGNYEGAIKDFREVLNLDPDDIDARNRLRELVGEKTVEQDVAKCRAQRDKELGNKCVSEKKWADAIRCYSSAIHNDPSNAIYYANRALCYLESNQLTLADEDCEAAIILDQNYVKAYFRRAKILLKLNKIEDAVECLETALSIEPGNAQVKKLLGEIRPSEIAASTTTVPTVGQTTQPEKDNKASDSDEECTPIPVSGPDYLQPIFKAPHERSRVPLKKIDIRDVLSFETAKDPEVPPNLPDKPRIQTVQEVQPTSEPEIFEVRNSDDFIRYWRDTGKNTQRTYLFLKTINGLDFPKIFKESMDGILLSEILAVLRDNFIKRKDKVGPYLTGLSQVPRFGIISLLMGKSDKEAVIDLLSYMNDSQELDKNQLIQLQKAFNVHTKM